MSRCWKRRSRKCMSLVGVSSARLEAHSQIKTTIMNTWCARLSEVLMTGDVYKNRSSSFVFFYIATLSLRHQNVDKNLLCGLQAHDNEDMSVFRWQTSRPLSRWACVKSMYIGIRGSRISFAHVICPMKRSMLALE